MKKRKELDALVPNGKVRKKQNSGSGVSHELLRVDSDTTDTEEFTVMQSRKFSSKKGGWFSRLCAACVPLCTLTLVTACIVGSGTLIWMQFGMRQEVDLLRDHLRKVEESSKGTASEFYGIHSQLNGLQKNHTALKYDVAQLNKTLEHMLKEVATLTNTAAELQKSIAEAPQIANLPKSVDSLYKSLANMGSQVNDFEVSLGQMKEQLGNNDKEKQQVEDGLDELKKKLDSVIPEQQTPNVDIKSLTDNLEFKKLRDTLLNTNNTIWQKLNWAILDLHDLHMVTLNLTQRINNLEVSPVDKAAIAAIVLEAVRANIKSLINDTIIASLNKLLPDNFPSLTDTNNTITVGTMLNYVQRLVKLYVSLVLKYQALPSENLQLLNDTLNLNLTKLIGDILSQEINSSIVQQDLKLKGIISSIVELISSYKSMKLTSGVLNEKLTALQEEINAMHMGNQSHMPEPVTGQVQLPLPTPTKVTSTASTELIYPSTPNASSAISTILAPTVTTMSVNMSMVPMNSTTAANSTANPSHIPKPNHTGGSLPDEDEIPKSGSPTN